MYLGTAQPRVKGKLAGLGQEMPNPTFNFKMDPGTSSQIER
jgi:hypothetical protein